MVCGAPGSRARGFEENGGKRRGRFERRAARPAERDRRGLSEVVRREDLSARGGGSGGTYRRGIGGAAAAELSEGRLPSGFQSGARAARASSIFLPPPS